MASRMVPLLVTQDHDISPDHLDPTFDRIQISSPFQTSPLSIKLDSSSSTVAYIYACLSTTSVLAAYPAEIVKTPASQKFARRLRPFRMRLAQRITITLWIYILFIGIRAVGSSRYGAPVCRSSPIGGGG
jgi:hypothetical protein